MGLFPSIYVNILIVLKKLYLKKISCIANLGEKMKNSENHAKIKGHFTKETDLFNEKNRISEGFFTLLLCFIVVFFN
jgi:hypothetical protein